jgi:hypothetical protein
MLGASPRARRGQRTWASEVLCLACHRFSWRAYVDPGFKTPEQHEKEVRAAPFGPSFKIEISTGSCSAPPAYRDRGGCCRKDE